MGHLHSVYDADPHFIIDADTRSIEYPSEEPLVLIQGDHNSEQFTFELPRFIDGHDMTLCDRVEVHYININSENSTDRSTGVYEVDDLQVSDTDEDTAVFSWLVSQNATKYVGSLSFAIRFACTTEAELDYAWNTSIYSSVTVSLSINNGEYVVETYPDILKAWYDELISAGEPGVNMVKSAELEALANIESAKDSSVNAVQEAEKAAIEHIESLEVIHEVEQQVIDNINTAGDNVLAQIETDKEEIIAEVVNRLPKYNGETEDVT